MTQYTHNQCTCTNVYRGKPRARVSYATNLRLFTTYSPQVLDTCTRGKYTSLKLDKNKREHKMNNTQLNPQTQPGVINENVERVFTHNVSVNLGGKLIANNLVLDAVNRLKEQARLEKIMAEQKKADQEIVKQFMGDEPILFDADGVSLATWKYTKDTEKLDAKLVKQKYPSIYNELAELVSGVRRFCLEK